MATKASYGVGVSRAPDIILQDQKSTTTNGGTFTTGTQTRILNTEVLDVNGDCSLASNQFTLTAGDYYLKASAPAYKTDRHKLILYNVTGSVAIDTGTSERAGSSGDASTRAIICTKFTVAASQALELRHYAQTTSTTLGFGLATSDGSTEIYAQVEIWRLS